tara:strand:- start:1307 stop:1759 length:453 start_codon:yes stop_codon:yes gene_type:complete
MKNILIVLFLAFSVAANGQTEQTHLPASTSVVGIWRQTGVVNPSTGAYMGLLSGNYKVINPDGTYFTFVSWGTKDPKKGTTIGQYGTYEIKSDSTFVEHITKHTIDPKLNGTSGLLKYKLVDKKTLMVAWKNSNEIWINEEWTRLPLSRQ